MFIVTQHPNPRRRNTFTVNGVPAGKLSDLARHMQRRFCGGSPAIIPSQGVIQFALPATALGDDAKMKRRVAGVAGAFLGLSSSNNRQQLAAVGSG